jgi:hypothetical protein
MAAKHSSGPWVVQDAEDGHLILMGEAASLSNGRQVQQFINYSHMLFPEDREQYEEAVANARLIAAAPELRDALENLLRVATIHSDITVSKRGRAAIESARAALARVDGDES